MIRFSFLNKINSKMGNCECVPVSNCNPFNPIGNGEESAVRIAKHKDQESDKTSLLSFSRLTLSNIDKSKYSTKDIDYENKLTYSLSRNSQSFLHTSRLSENEQQREVTIEILEKLSVKDCYDLKKIIHNLHQTIDELQLPFSYFEIEKIDLNNINEKQFRKVLLKNEANQENQICFFKGSMKEEAQIKIIEGKGELFFQNGAYYNGNFISNRFEKIGLYIHPDKDYYYGSWKMNSANGFGQFGHYEGVLCKGNWANDLQHGLGEEYWPDGAIFRGYFQRGTKKKGRFSWPNKSYYEGQFIDNKFEGKGVFYWEDGRLYDGYWKDNMMHGLGLFQWPNGQTFYGYYENDKKHGKGQLTLSDGTLIKGRWIEGKLEGLSEVVKDGAILQVRWRDGVQVNL